MSIPEEDLLINMSQGFAILLNPFDPETDAYPNINDLRNKTLFRNYWEVLDSSRCLEHLCGTFNALFLSVHIDCLNNGKPKPIPDSLSKFFNIIRHLPATDVNFDPTRTEEYSDIFFKALNDFRLLSMGACP